MKKDNMDRLFEHIYENEGERIEDLKDIPIPPMDKVMSRFNESINEKHGIKKENKYSPCKKAAITAASVLVIFIIPILIQDIPQVSALKFNIRKQINKVENGVRSIRFSDEKEQVQPSANDSDELEEILTLKELQDKTEFHALIPNYLPKGYKEKSVKLFTHPDNQQIVEQIYIKDGGKNKIEFTQYTKGDEANGEVNTRAENKFEKINIDGKEVNLITRPNVMYTALWFYNGFKFELIIRDPISRNEVIKIIEELK
ncbi:DUF4367 domain-containing protein [Clostridium lundense]|uniref:DUF4367 domain-containing protein n=1 Tax=Clostridium lundense TaxID=319475 RepID=UPI0004881100|nr:DUF4367 domain-containing protein [Clostridium lundense]